MVVSKKYGEKYGKFFQKKKVVVVVGGGLLQQQFYCSMISTFFAQKQCFTLMHWASPKKLLNFYVTAFA